MATPTQIAELRLEIQEPNNVAPYTDEFLSEIIDLYGVRPSAQKVWISKRNAVAKLVDITEGGSSRKMSQLFDNYDKIVKGYDEDDGGGVTPSGRYSMTRQATRV